MSINRTKTQQYLRTFDFKTLFREELGWDNFATPLPIMVEGVPYRLQGVAEKRGVAVFVLACSGAIPPYELRRKIERQVALRFREHLIIYSDGSKTTQVWQWMRDEAGKPLASREHPYDLTHSGESLIQKLELLAVSIEEEEKLNLPGVLSRVRSAFDVEKVTKKFYEEFKRQHTAFSKFLQGVPVGDLAEWYVSVMLNRLMFVYFIQKKDFLAGDPDYLRNRLAASKDRGSDRFYRDFLCPLFFDGFATPIGARSPEVKALLGDVPYLNGGIFARHQIEQAHGQEIQIPDKAFDKLFDFFEDYQWHLDDRPLHNDNEINPDVLGFIFEKYINQKQMGAYYTKEDITEYIGKNTIVPYLLDAAGRAEPSFFKAGSSAWDLLRVNPERYIYPAVAKGAEIPLPPEVAVGVEDVAQRGEWNKPAADEYALPTEIWRETIARRQRYAEVRGRLAAGEVCSAADLITYNLNIRRFAQDVIETCEDARLLRALWKSIRGISVLDPTCGSGAFHFAALNILEPLYEGCLKRMAAFVAEEDQKGSGHARYDDFRKVLAEVARHPNQRYFVTKSIIVDNLYGVDIMHEAVEIAKLRLFLKLVSLVDDASKVEPLPDIDFNIRAGNTLVGFATRQEMEGAVRGDRLLLLPEDEELLASIDEQAADVDRLFARFRQMQTEYDPRDFGDDYATTKQTLRQRLETLAGELDRLLAQQYGVTPDTLDFEQWRESHQPFHWFAEFYGIIKLGGFDVIIGNPPWSEYASVRKVYQVRDYSTEKAGNLYGLCIERSLVLRSGHGYLSFIVQLPLASSSRMNVVRSLLQQKSNYLQVIPFDDRPAKLFEGLEHSRSVIFISRAGENGAPATLVTARYQRWYSQVRPTLFYQLTFTCVSGGIVHANVFPKYGHSLQQSLFQKVKATGKATIEQFLGQRQSQHFIFYQEATQYWAKATVNLPYYAKNGKVGAPAHGRYIYLKSPEAANSVCALLNSSLFYAYFIAYGDCFHLSQTLVSKLPIPTSILEDSRLVDLNQRLMQDLLHNAQAATIKTKAGDEISYATFYCSQSKPIIDEIDACLAQHYGFTPEELDYIINYDIKYRMGDALGGGDETDDAE